MWFINPQVGEIAVDRVIPTSMHIIEAKLAKSGSDVTEEREWKILGVKVTTWVRIRRD
jgi:hypothetical protein